MTRTTYQRHEELITDPLPIALGGTAAKTATEALDNLQLVNRNLIGQPNGVTPLDAEVKIPIQFLPPADVYGISVNGALTGFGGVTQTFKITDFDFDTVYTISCDAGTISRTNDTITFTPPNSTGLHSFTVNGVTYVLNVTASSIVKPIIITPSNNASDVSLTPLLVGNTPNTIGLQDTLHASHWEVCQNNDFTTDVLRFDITTDNKLICSITTDLVLNTVFYCRVRYEFETMGLSEWSDVLSFITITSINLSELQILSPGPNVPEFIQHAGTHVTISHDKQVIILGSPEAEEILGDAYFGRGSIHFFKRNGNSYEYQNTIRNPKEIQGPHLAQYGSSPNPGYFGLDVKISLDKQTIFVAAQASKQTGGLNDSVIYVYKTTTPNDYSSLVIDQILEPPFATGALIYYNWSDINAISLSANEEYLFVACAPGFDDYNDTNFIAPMGCIIIYRKVNGIYEYNDIINNPGLTDYRLGDSVNSSVMFARSATISADGNTVAILACGFHTSSDPENAKMVLIYEKINNVWTFIYSVPAIHYAENYGTYACISPDGNYVVSCDNFILNNEHGTIYVSEKQQAGWVTNYSLTLENLMINLLPNAAQGTIRGQDINASYFKFSSDNQFLYIGIEGASSQLSFPDYGEGVYDGCVIKCSFINGVITPLEYLFPSNALANSGFYFGTQFDIADKTLVVASWADFSTSDPNISGGAYVYE
jgi:hypothetical protein